MNMVRELACAAYLNDNHWGGYFTDWQLWEMATIGAARALAMDPAALLFDEPTSALDPELEGEVLRVIKSLADEDRTMLLVTHDMRFARDVSDKVVFLHQGRIEEEGTPEELFDNPKSERLQQFLSASVER